MALIDKIESVQKKPENIKRRILFISLVVIMFFIIAIWALTFNVKMERVVKENDNASMSSPLGVFKSIFKDSVKIGSEGAEKVKNAINEIGDK
ncbi:MAG: hypothetical protein COV02_01685 [Candidatus Terrybacteria bacterium CG10_big_fil_rev_8_21_14_0_10_41_10]|uniref:Uncharacterized protein n=1 Tax=Candidatus Terrybacteria bacterium CG10_big_fil_rev_8_21_14_0_10_41_10 TaxID=1975026 RepID=A0A2M8LAF2_9BACT|nr:MAG: hypothetical protein COV02_01685 [Candidatus Terrybacteria bacterium CG10_big_fil_rev_8_21_14_0_10_41_10]